MSPVNTQIVKIRVQILIWIKQTAESLETLLCGLQAQTACHPGGLSRLPFHLDLLPAVSRVHLATRFPGALGLNRACPLQAVYSRKTRAGVRGGGGAGRGGTRRRGGRQVGRRRLPVPHLMQSPFRKLSGSPGSPGKRFRTCSPATVYRPGRRLPRFILMGCPRKESGRHLPASREGPATEHPAAARGNSLNHFQGRLAGTGEQSLNAPLLPSCVLLTFSSLFLKRAFKVERIAGYPGRLRM